MHAGPIRLFAAAVAASLLLAPAAPAQQAPAPLPSQPITFEQAIEIALRQNALLRQARNAAELEEAGVRQQRLQFGPDLRFSTNGAQNYGRSFSQSEGRIVDQASQSLSGGVQSSVTLFNGNTNRANLRGAQLSEQASIMDVARAEQTVVFTVATNFLNLVTQQEQLRVMRENLAAQEAQEAQIQAYVNAGVRPISDLYQQQASVASARSNLVESERAVELAKVDLMQTLQLDPRMDYTFQPPAVDTTLKTVTVPSLDSLLERAFVNRRDLEAQETRVLAAQQDIRAAQGGRWPALSLSVGYNTAYNSAADDPFGRQLADRRGGSVGLGVSLPLFDRGAASLATQRARLLSDNARIALENREREVGLQVRRAYLDLRSFEQQVSAAEAQLRAARQALNVTQQRYQVGAATLVELTQAQAVMVQAASAQVRARYSLAFQRTLLDYYVGDLVPREVTLR